MDFKDNYFYKLGKFYGYPDCCIYDFVNKIRTKEQIKASKYSGFIPCVKHAEEILAKKIKIEDLISNRVCKSEFPN
jgi:hypothetical protein